MYSASRRRYLPEGKTYADMHAACEKYRAVLRASEPGARVRLRKDKDTRLSFVVPKKKVLA